MKDVKCAPFKELTRHVEYHRPTAVNARLAEEAGHRVVGDGGDGDARIHGAERDQDSLIHTIIHLLSMLMQMYLNLKRLAKGLRESCILL